MGQRSWPRGSPGPNLGAGNLTTVNDADWAVAG